MEGDMSKVELTEGVYWVGAIDWNIRDFHGYSVKTGTTFNAFLIVDQKIALIDTVKPGFAEGTLQKIREIIDPQKIDYLISNHVEMDHSGSLPTFVDVAGDCKLISSKMGKVGLSRHFKKDWPFQVVKTGDEISLGNKTLQFVDAPMLHWPDSMCTYIKEDGILFSTDIFGQHVATSYRFDDEAYDIDIMYDAKKYYANIFMPYPTMFLKLAEKIAEMDVKLRMIAPDHGLIWRKEPQKIFDVYVDWSKGKGKNKIVVVYDTMWGSTEKMALAIVKGIMDDGVEARLMNLRKSHRSDVATEILDAKGIVLGSPTIHRDIFPTLGDFLVYMRGLRPKNKIAAAFGSYGWGGEAVKILNKSLEEVGFEVVEDGVRIHYIPDETELQTCVELGRRMAQKVKEMQ
jgi:flavorubredoxin